MLSSFWYFRNIKIIFKINIYFLKFLPVIHCQPQGTVRQLRQSACFLCEPAKYEMNTLNYILNCSALDLNPEPNFQGVSPC